MVSLVKRLRIGKLRTLSLIACGLILSTALLALNVQAAGPETGQSWLSSLYSWLIPSTHDAALTPPIELTAPA